MIHKTMRQNNTYRLDVDIFFDGVSSFAELKFP